MFYKSRRALATTAASLLLWAGCHTTTTENDVACQALIGAAQDSVLARAQAWNDFSARRQLWLGINLAAEGGSILDFEEKAAKETEKLTDLCARFRTQCLYTLGEQAQTMRNVCFANDGYQYKY